MGSSIENNLEFICLRKQPRINECWMMVTKVKSLETLFYVKRVKSTWKEQSIYHNEMATVIQKFFRKYVNNNVKCIRCTLCDDNHFNEIVYYECIKCKTDITIDNTCDFCETNYCDKCCPDEISYHSCDECNQHWCYRNTRYCDYYCDKNKRCISGCWNCGN